MRKYQLLLFVFLALGVLTVTKFVLADVAPDEPDCVKVDSQTGQPGCGFLNLYTQLNTSSYKDKFVFLSKISGYEDESIQY
ncbi:MAG TPA: hypothetical protein VE973_03670, partial [Candidatus Limnocylindria bacterium]|nr:hypothetical protein [Candidatus Limnocylindria bacterium]